MRSNMPGGLELSRTFFSEAHGTGISEIVHAPNLKNKIGAGSPCTIRCRVCAHSELEKLRRESDPPCRPAATRSRCVATGGEAGAIQREKNEEKRITVNHPRRKFTSCKCSVLLATNREIYTKHSYFLSFQKYLYCFLTYRQIGILLC